MHILKDSITQILQVNFASHSIIHDRKSLTLTLDEKQDEEEFMRKLALLRGHAEVFLKMLNDMRRRLKEIPQSTLQAQQYRYDTDFANKLHDLCSALLEM